MDNVMVFFMIWMAAAEDGRPPDKSSCLHVMQADIDAADFQALND
jgi:hypothetical protein